MTERERETERDRDRQRHRDRQTETETETDRDRDRERQRERESVCVCVCVCGNGPAKQVLGSIQNTRLTTLFSDPKNHERQRFIIRKVHSNRRTLRTENDF